MKTAIKNLIALTLVVLTSATLTTKANDNTVTVLSDVKKVNQINVSGNVELILIQSADENVKVYDTYYTKNALVQQKGTELRISSYEKETLIVVAYVSNLSSITASENAIVKTHGKFNALNLDVNLNNNSKAILNTNAISLNANVKGNASLTLTGSALEYNGLVSNLSTVSTTDFVAETATTRAQNVNPVVSANTIVIGE